MAKKNTTEMVDLEKEVLLRISGDPSVNTLPWQVLRDVGDNLQKLVKVLAENASRDSEFIPEHFDLEFTGFYKGSSVPAFAFSKCSQLGIVSDSHVKKKVSEDFTFVISKLSSGKLDEIAKPFESIEVKNLVIQTVAALSNSAGQYNLSVAKRDRDGNIKPVYKVRKISDEVLKILTIKQITEDLLDLPEESVPGIARVVITRKGKGKEYRKTKSIFVGKEAEASMRFDQIPTKRGVYELNHPVAFFVVEEGKGIILENQELDIYAPGRTPEEAKLEAFEQFDESYSRLIKLSDKQLSPHLLTAKRLFKLAVKSFSKNG